MSRDLTEVEKVEQQAWDNFYAVDTSFRWTESRYRQGYNVLPRDVEDVLDLLDLKRDRKAKLAYLDRW